MLQKFEQFLEGNKLFVVGLLSAVLIDLQQFFTATSLNWLVVGFSVVVAGLSYAAKTLTGKIGSLVGIAGSAVATVSTIAYHGSVNWIQLLVTTGLATLAVVSGSAIPITPPPSKN